MHLETSLVSNQVCAGRQIHVGSGNIRKNNYTAFKPMQSDIFFLVCLFKTSLYLKQQHKKTLMQVFFLRSAEVDSMQI